VRMACATSARPFEDVLAIAELTDQAATPGGRDCRLVPHGRSSRRTSTRLLLIRRAAHWEGLAELRNNHRAQIKLQLAPQRGTWRSDITRLDDITSSSSEGPGSVGRNLKEIDPFYQDQSGTQIDPRGAEWRRDAAGCHYSANLPSEASAKPLAGLAADVQPNSRASALSVTRREAPVQPTWPRGWQLGPVGAMMLREPSPFERTTCRTAWRLNYAKSARKRPMPSDRPDSLSSALTRNIVTDASATPSQAGHDLTKLREYWAAG
jgi:hypothetical protein